MDRYVVVYQAGPDHKRRAFATRTEAETFYRSTKGKAYVVTLPDEGGESNGSTAKRTARARTVPSVRPRRSGTQGRART
jgi:hypothetical protein